MSEQPVVRTTLADGVLHVVLDRPPANALGKPMYAGLDAAVDELEADGAKVAVVSSAIDGFFMAGADLKQMTTCSDEEFLVMRDELRAPLERLAACGKPSIAAIDGLALGGGLELACACSLRFATPRAKLGVPEVKLGIIPGAGGTQRLPRLLGRGRALQLLLLGDEVDGTEAERIGLVERLVDGDVVEEALAVARRLGGYSAQAMKEILDSVRAAELTPAEGMAFEGEAVARTFVEGEARIGVQAFVEKRRPTFA
jgi:enoyl-CoA hydratase/carnithine racemase